VQWDFENVCLNVAKRSRIIITKFGLSVEGGKMQGAAFLSTDF